MFKTILPPLTI